MLDAPLGRDTVCGDHGGEPGIGKTRLASELARAVHREGALVLYGRCDEGLAVGDLAPELGRLLPELAGVGEPIRNQSSSRFEAAAALLEAMTREQQILVVLDDLHWATNPTLLLLLRHLIPLGASPTRARAVHLP